MLSGRHLHVAWSDGAFLCFQVDIFSFGMFLYELLVLKLPFVDSDSGVNMANLKGHILAGGRPTLTQKVSDNVLGIVSFIVMGGFVT